MTDEELTKQLHLRQEQPQVNSPGSQICLDLFAVSEAVQQALIANNCQP